MPIVVLFVITNLIVLAEKKSKPCVDNIEHNHFEKLKLQGKSEIVLITKERYRNGNKD
jgi:hypothetical protein